MHTVGKGIKCSIYLLVKVSFVYLLPVSFVFMFYLQNDNIVQCYSVLSDFYPMANDDYFT